MNYNETVTFDHSVERLIAGTEDDYEELILQVKGKACFTPGKYYGAPEDSYPDESEVETLSCTYKGEDFTKKLTKEELERIEEAIVEQAQEAAGGADDDYAYESYRDRDFSDYED